MNDMKSTFIAATLLAGTMVAGTALAQGLTYNYADIMYGSYSITHGGPSGGGLAADVSYDVTPNINLVASADSVSINGGTYAGYTAGVGYHMSMGAWDLLGDVRYLSNPYLSTTYTGYAIHVGGRIAVSPQVELKATVGQSSVSNGTTYSGSTYDIGGAYHLNKKWGISADYFSDPDAEYWNVLRVGARYNF
jgi:hypothetical protein